MFERLSHALQPFPAAFIAAIDLVHTHQLGLKDNQPRTELLICLSSDGSYVIDAVVGEKDRVDLTKKMQTIISSDNGCRLVHNHPSGGSLSAADWQLALKHPGIREIVAVNHRKTLFRGVPLNIQGSAFNQLIEDPAMPGKINESVFQPYRDEFNQALKEGYELTNPLDMENELGWIWGHLINERFRDKGYVNYTASLSVRDENILINAKYSDIIQRGRNLISKFIL